MIQKRLIVQGEEISYRLCKRKGMRYMRLSYSPLRGLSVSAPRWYPLFAIERFIQEKTEWIRNKMKQFPLALSEAKNSQDNYEYRMKREEAKHILQNVADKYAIRYGIEYRKLTVRNQYTRWGSCSRAKNLSFQYKAAFLPDHLRDYIVMHELCHIREMNHSKKFWDLVANAIPDYKEMKRELKKNHLQ
jgi:predicted metal-dependent hydrolase